MLRRLFNSCSSAPSTRALVALGLVFMLTLPGVTRRMYASDEIEYFSFLRSLWFDRDVSFDNEYRHFYDTGVVHYDGFRETFLERETETGLRLNFGTIGAALLWAPFYAVADAGARLARAAGIAVETDGYSAPYVSAVCLGSACYGLLAIMLSWCAAHRVLRLANLPSGAAPTVAAWTAWLGTPLLFYMYVAPPMSHAVSAFSVAAFILAWLAVRERWTPAGMLVLGLLGALMAMVREQDAFVVIGPAIDLAWSIARDRRWRLAWSAIVGAVAFAAGYLPQALTYLALNGYVGPSRLVSRKMTWTAPHALGVLFSTEHGFLFWTPLAALALAGLGVLVARGARRDAAVDRSPAVGGPGTAAAMRVALCLIAVVAFQVYVAGSVESWTVAGAFGQRRFVGLTVVLVIGLAALWARLGRRWARGLAGVAAALCIWWNLGLMVQFGTGLMDRQRLELGRNAYNTFITVPRRLPEIAYRYMFERERFYRRAPGAAPAGRP